MSRYGCRIGEPTYARFPVAHISPQGKKWRVQTYVQGKRSSQTFKTEALARAWADRFEAKAAGMPQLRALLSDHRILPLLPFKFRQAMEKANYTESEIIASAFSVEYDSGVYFLVREGRVVYIGKTTNVLARVLKHRQTSKKFDSFSFIPCLPEHMDELERTYICLLMPDENQKMC